MKDINEINPLMAELLEDKIAEGKFTQRGIEIINEIADYAENTEFFKENKQQGETIFELGSAENIFNYILERVVNAPFGIYRTASVILIMPFLRQKLKETTGAANDE